MWGEMILFSVQHFTTADQDLNNGGPLSVCTIHMQDKDPPLPLRKEKPIAAGMGIGSPPHTSRSS